MKQEVNILMDRIEFISAITKRLTIQMQNWIDVETRYDATSDMYSIFLNFNINDKLYNIVINESCFDVFHTPFFPYSSHDDMKYTESDIENGLRNIKCKVNELAIKLFWKDELDR